MEEGKFGGKMCNNNYGSTIMEFYSAIWRKKKNCEEDELTIFDSCGRKLKHSSPVVKSCAEKWVPSSLSLFLILFNLSLKFQNIRFIRF